MREWTAVEPERRLSGKAYIEVRKGNSEPICLVDRRGEIVSTAELVRDRGSFGWRVWEREYERFLERVRDYWVLVTNSHTENKFPKPDLVDLIKFQKLVRQAAGWSEGDEERFYNDPCAWEMAAIFGED